MRLSVHSRSEKTVASRGARVRRTRVDVDAIAAYWVDRIERLLQGQEADEAAPQLPLDFIDYLEGRLAQIKQAAIEDYARGRLEKDEALVGILTLVSDTRHLLMQRRNEVCHQSAGAGRASRLIDAA